MLRRCADVGTSSNVTLLIFFCGDVASLIGETFLTLLEFVVLFSGHAAWNLSIFIFFVFCIVNLFFLFFFCNRVRLSCSVPQMHPHRTFLFFFFFFFNPSLPSYFILFFLHMQKSLKMPRTPFKVVLKWQKLEFISD